MQNYSIPTKGAALSPNQVAPKLKMTLIRDKPEF
jgi:hypothetical protein